MAFLAPRIAPASGLIAIQVSPTGGAWRLTSHPAAYSNATVGTGDLAAVEAPTGTYAVAFDDLPGYRAPEPQTNTVIFGELTTFTGTYLGLGSLAIQVTPTGGAWRLTSHPAAYSNATSGTGDLAAVEAPTGSYAVAFDDLPGYRAPAPQTNTLATGETLIFEGVYLRRPAPFDFDGDHKTDAGVFDADSSYWYILLSGNAGLLSGPLGWNETRPVVGDFDGDGKADAGVFHRQSGWWFISQSSNGLLLSGLFSWGDARPAPADYDGDGKTDAAVFDRDTGAWCILQSASGQALIGQFGWGDARPVPADYDGDARADVAFYERGSGAWQVFLSGSSNIVSHTFGPNNARPVPGDYDGDGKTEAAMYYRAFGLWYVLQTNGALATLSFGGPEFNPAPGDYDGDGKTDAAVFDRTTANWYACASSSGATLSGQWGQPGMCSLPSCDNGAIAGLVMLAFGDSITYGCGSSSGGPATGYPALLERILEPAFGGHFVSVNEGYPGETTEEALGRFEATLLAVRPDILLLMEGTNDEFDSLPYDQTEDNLRYMVLTAQRHGVQVVIATIPPVISNQYHDRSDQQARIQDFNPRIHQIAADYGIPLAPVFESITAVPGWASGLMDQPSANHPNDAGYLVVRDAFFGAISEGINSGLFY